MSCSPSLFIYSFLIPFSQCKAFHFSHYCANFPLSDIVVLLREQQWAKHTVNIYLTKSTGQSKHTHSLTDTHNALINGRASGSRLMKSLGGVFGMREGGLLVLARPLTPAASSRCLSAFGNLKGYYSANLTEREGKK